VTEANADAGSLGADGEDLVGLLEVGESFIVVSVPGVPSPAVRPVDHDGEDEVAAGEAQQLAKCVPPDLKALAAGAAAGVLASVV
jgi:hypothetical protein